MTRVKVWVTGRWARLQELTPWSHVALACVSGEVVGLVTAPLPPEGTAASLLVPVAAGVFAGMVVAVVLAWDLARWQRRTGREP